MIIPSVLMCLYEIMAHIVTLVHLCMNEVKYEDVGFKGVT